jgi:hypothetical protein
MSLIPEMTTSVWDIVETVTEDPFLFGAINASDPFILSLPWKDSLASATLLE